MKTHAKFIFGIGVVLAAVLLVASSLGAPPKVKGAPKPTQLPKDTPVTKDPNKVSYPLPDLVILEVSTKGGKTQVHVKNLGNAASAPCLISAGVAGGSTGGFSVQTGVQSDVPTLKPGEDKWISLGNFQPLGAMIDPDKKVKESNENNNSWKP